MVFLKNYFNYYYYINNNHFTPCFNDILMGGLGGGVMRLVIMRRLNLNYQCRTQSDCVGLIMTTFSAANAVVVQQLYLNSHPPPPQSLSLLLML